MPAAQPSSEPRVADLVAAGCVRAGLFPPQYTRDAATGALSGPWLEVIRALGAQIGVPAVVVELPTPDALIECLAAGRCDIGSLGFDPERAGLVEGFSPAFMQVDYSALVPAGSAIATFADLDRPGLRIAAVRGHASTLALSRLLKHAAQAGADTPAAAFELLRTGQADAWASIRPTLVDYSRKLPGSRVLAESYGANRPALVVAKGHTARLAYASAFVEQAKALGRLQDIIAAHPGYRVPA
jgi:polar amino acid transport system substrate-binding protein